MRRWFLGLLVALAIGGAWLLRRDKAETAPLHAAAPPAAASRSPAASAPMPSEAGQARPIAAGPVAAGSQAQRWAEREREWCATGQRLATHGTGPAQAHSKALNDHAEIASEAFEELRVEWERRLRARPEPMAQASADLLWLMIHADSAREGALARLRELSERTRDPELTGLAAQAHCTHGAPECAGLLALWLELEPGHLSALALMAPETKSAPAAMQAHLERLSQARGLRDPKAAFMRQLEALEPHWGPGLRRYALMGVSAYYDAVYANPSWRSVLEHCRTDRPECGRAAEHLWSAARSATEQVYFMVMARARRPLPEVWQLRARESEALQQWAREHAESLLVNGIDEETRCEPRGVGFDWLRDAMLDGGLKRLRAEAPKDPATQRLLSERFRRTNQRSVLDLHK